jgi:hypothetical protein
MYFFQNIETILILIKEIDMSVYLDYNASASIDERVLDFMVGRKPA